MCGSRKGSTDSCVYHVLWTSEARLLLLAIECSQAGNLASSYIGYCVGARMKCMNYARLYCHGIIIWYGCEFWISVPLELYLFQLPWLNYGCCLFYTCLSLKISFIFSYKPDKGFRCLTHESVSFRNWHGKEARRIPPISKNKNKNIELHE